MNYRCCCRTSERSRRTRGSTAMCRRSSAVAASVVTEAFNRAHGWYGRAHFDARAFTIPDPVEVENYFIWRQQDAVRNSIQGLAQAHFSAKQLHGVNTSAAQELLFQEKGINWNDTPAYWKRGRCAVYHGEAGWSIDRETPTFTQDRDYLRRMIPRAWDEAGVSDARLTKSDEGKAIGSALQSSAMIEGSQACGSATNPSSSSNQSVGSPRTPQPEGSGR
jgi:hypothetical protein